MNQPVKPVVVRMGIDIGKSAFQGAAPFTVDTGLP